MSWWRSLCGKAHLIRRLRIRYGFDPIAGLVFDPFEFRSQEPPGQIEEWKNIEQLEAVVEFFVNYRPDPVPAGADTWGDPWAANAMPLDDDHAQYTKVNLGRIEGTDAEVTGAPGGNVIKLDGEPDLSDVIINPPNIDNANNNPIVGPPMAANYPQRRRYLYDTLWLKEDTRRPSKLYRVMDVCDDDNAKTVTLDDRPNFNGKTKSKWKLNRRPIIVVIDPLGARTITNPNPPNATTVWSGAAATIIASNQPAQGQTILQLDGVQPLDRINKDQDTIYLPKDTASRAPARTYRIIDVLPNRQIVVSGTPSFSGGSAWHLPAGLSGTLSAPFQYDIDPPTNPPNPPQRGQRGHDHYDADLFIIHRGQVISRFRFTSFTSRDYGTPWRGGANWRQQLSSIRGNGQYYYHAWRSPEPPAGDPDFAAKLAGARYRNYSLAIVDATPAPNGLQHDQNDHVSRARFYSGTPAPPAPAVGGVGGNTLARRVMEDSGAAAPAGKGHVRFHRGNRQAANSGSAGCVVSPIYHEMRNALIRIYEEEYREFYGPGAVDNDIHRLVDNTANPNGLSINGSEGIWNVPLVTNAQFNYKLTGTFWLIRPDEPPLS